MGSTWIVEKISCNISYSMEESGPFLWWKVGATQRLNIKLQSKSEPLKVEHWCGQINWTMNHVGRRWMFWDNQCNEVLRQIDKCGSVNDTRHGMPRCNNWSHMFSKKRQLAIDQHNSWRWWCVFMMELVLLKGGDNTSSHHLCLTIKGCPGKLEVGRLDAQRWY